MTLDELRSSLSKVKNNDGSIGVTVYAITKNNNEPQKLDIEATALDGLKSLFVKEIEEKIIAKPNLALIDLSSADERKDAIYRYDVAVPDDLKQLESVTQKDDWKTLDIKRTKLTEVKSLVIEIGNSNFQIVLYKMMAAVNILLPTSSFSMIAHNTRLKKLDDEIIRITPNFQIMRVDGEIIVISLETLEKSFGYQEVIKKEAALGIGQITKLGLVEDPKSLDILLENTRLARKIVKIAKDSPVLRLNISNDQIIKFCMDFPSLKGKIKFNSTNDKIVLSSNKSKELFLKLLMDDFLTSELTKSHYESLAKDGVDLGEEGQA